ncbi:DNA polymerase [Bradyrhizobium quebecense]|uniref:DNA-directed DNA polymerase n=1 Tax=Bradyrhizobium quebecense TaxID=2748629 RepID=A0A974ADL1_9BRAD|nr:DNA polymerase [Bradyrhizobium quebecense]UGA46827.1 DNA polymerase [Bradyrhizobium quebecense]
MKRYLWDSESDGFVHNATKVHCIVIRDVDTKETWDYKPDQIDAALDKLAEADVLIGHNIQRHDLPLVLKLLRWAPKPDVIIRDTMICARVIFPNVKATDGDLVRAGKMPAGRKYAGKHTLGAWGYRLGEQKGDYAEDRLEAYLAAGGDKDDEAAISAFVWGEWNPEMHAYMIQDAVTNDKLWDHLKVEAYSQDAIVLEHRIARVCDAIQAAGVPFDVKKAEALHATLLTAKHKVEQQLITEFGSWQVELKSLIPKRDNKKLGYVKGVPVRKFKTVTFNPGSRDHIAKVLSDKGWKATKFTDGGKPQIDEEVIEGIVARFPEFAGLGEYLMLDKRISQLADGPQAWLKAVGPDGRIHGVINPMGTITSRASHFLPNLGQVPNMASPYGKECRELFYAPEGFTFLGADMSGLELRGLAHYLAPFDGGKYMKIVVEGDVHWMHATVMGLATGERDKHNKCHTIIREDGTKRFIYAYIYGAWDAKVGEIIYNALTKAKRDGGEDGAELYVKFFGDKTATEESLKALGRKVRAAFAKRIVGFTSLKDKLSVVVKKAGRVRGLDDRLIPIRSDHSALNFLIQSCGAILCKRWGADAFEELCSKYKLGEDFQFVAWVHDEWQLLVRKGLEEEISEVIIRCARKAGEPYGFRGPLDSQAKHGPTWAETH